MNVLKALNNEMSFIKNNKQKVFSLLSELLDVFYSVLYYRRWK